MEFIAEDMLDMRSAEKVAEAGPEALREKLLPADAALASWPERRIDEDAAERFTGGQAVPAAQVETRVEAGWVRVYSAGGRQFLGVGEQAADGMIAPRRIFRLSTGAAACGQGKKP